MMYFLKSSLTLILGLFLIVPQFTFAQSDAALRPVAATIKAAKIEGQNFPARSVFQRNSSPTESLQINKEVRNATQISLNIAQLTALRSANLQSMKLEIPYKNNQTLQVELIRADPLSDDFTVITDQSNGRAVSYTAGQYFRGILKGDDQSIAAFSFFENEIIGMISTQAEGNIVIGKLQEAKNIEKYIAYSDRELKTPNTSACGTTIPDNYGEKMRQMLSHAANHGSRSTSCIKVYIEGDFALNNNKGGVANATNYLTAMFNQVATLYQNEQIPTVTSQIFIWTTQDPYSTSSSSAALSTFRTTRTSFNGDIAHLAALGGNGLGGVAYLDVLCSSGYRYAYSNINSTYNTVPTYSWTIEVFTHEMGHNIGSPHTQSCSWTGGALDNCYATEGGCPPGPAPTNGGTIMSYCHLTSYGINFNNGFGVQPGNLIRAYVDAASCLVVCAGAGACTVPTTLASSNILTTTATVSWAAVISATKYNLQYKTSTASTWTTVSNITPTTYNLTGLTANTLYYFKVQSVCTSGTSAYATQAQFTTLVPCGVPTNLTSFQISSTSASVQWDVVANATSYDLQYKTSAATAWITVSTTDPFYQLYSLLPNTVYNFKVRAICPFGTSAYSTASDFKTLPICGGDPISLSSSQVNDTSAVISWGYMDSAISYNVQYKPNAATAWITLSNIQVTSISLAPLTPNTNYVFRVQAVCPEGNSNFSATSLFTTSGSSCGVPSGLTATNITTTSATLGWAAVQGASSYNVQYKTSASASWSASVSVAGNSYNLTGLTASTPYNFRVQAVCGSSVSAFSASGTFTTLQGAAVCAVPTNLSAANISNTGATVTWAAVSGAVTYNLQYKVSGTTAWTSVSVATESYTLSNLTADTRYDFQVQTVCGGGVSSAYSSVQTFTTLGNGGGTSCAAPTGIVVSSVSATSVVVSWSTATGAIAYIVNYKPVAAAIWLSQTVTATTATLVNLLPATQYVYQVQTVCQGDGVVSGFSPQGNFTTSEQISCNPVTNLKSTSVNNSSAVISWTAAQGGAVNYTLQYKLSSASNWTSVTVAGNTFTLTGLLSGTTYTYRVQTNCQSSATSDWVSGGFTTTGCSTPSNITFSNISYNTATVRWNNVSGVLYYVLQYREAGVSNWITAAATLYANTFVLNGLQPSRMYEVRVQTRCVAGASSYSDAIKFTTTGCVAPSGLAANNISADTAILSWNTVAGATLYNVSYKIDTASAWRDTVNLVNNSVKLKFLRANTKYVFRVQANCPFGLSDFSPNTAFTTSGTANCGAPTGLVTAQNTASSATLTWNKVSGATSYLLQFKRAAQNPWSLDIAVSDTSFLVTGLAASTNCQFRVRALCGANYSNYTSANFNTVVGCGAPQDITVSGITTTEATLRWTAIPNILDYILQYKKSSETNWTTVSNANLTSIFLNGLTTATTYNYRMRTACSSTDSSTYTLAANFTTDGCLIPTVLSANVTGNISKLSWVGSAWAYDYNLQYKILTDTVWQNVAADTSYYTLNNLLPATNYQYRVQSICSGGNSAYSDPFRFSTVAQQPAHNASFDTEKPSIVLVPNPAHEVVNIRLFMTNKDEKANTQLLVFNVNGAVVLRRILNPDQSSTSLDISELPSGFYFLKVVGGNGTVLSEKFVKE